jgi:hypothetical protein
MLKKKMSHPVRFIFAIQCAALLGVGCGPARSMPTKAKDLALTNGDTSPSLEVKTVNLLDMKVANRILEKGSRRNYSEVSSLNENRIVTEKQIVYERPFPRRGRGLYFLWPKDFLGSDILNGFITYRVWKAANQWTPDLLTVPIRYDSMNSVWFVPVFDVIQQRSSDRPPESAPEDQIFILQMSLSNQINREIEIRFRIQD